MHFDVYCGQGKIESVKKKEGWVRISEIFEEWDMFVIYQKEGVENRAFYSRRG